MRDTATLLGHMALSAEHAAHAGARLDLPDEAVKLLQVVPYKG